MFNCVPLVFPTEAETGAAAHQWRPVSEGESELMQEIQDGAGS